MDNAAQRDKEFNRLGKYFIHRNDTIKQDIALDIHGENTPLFLFASLQNMPQFSEPSKAVLKEHRLATGNDLRHQISRELTYGMSSSEKDVKQLKLEAESANLWFHEDYEAEKGLTKRIALGRASETGMSAAELRIATYRRAQFLKQEEKRAAQLQKQQELEEKQRQQATDPELMASLMRQGGAAHLACITIEEFRAYTGLSDAIISALRLYSIYNLAELAERSFLEISGMRGFGWKNSNALNNALSLIGGYTSDDLAETKEAALQRSRQWLHMEKNVPLPPRNDVIELDLQQQKVTSAVEENTDAHMDFINLNDLYLFAGLSAACYKKLGQHGIFTLKDIAGHNMHSLMGDKYLPNDPLSKKSFDNLQAALAKVGGYFLDEGDPEVIEQKNSQSRAWLRQNKLVPQGQFIFDNQASPEQEPATTEHLQKFTDNKELLSAAGLDAGQIEKLNNFLSEQNLVLSVQPAAGNDRSAQIPKPVQS